MDLRRVALWRSEEQQRYLSIDEFWSSVNKSEGHADPKCMVER